MSDTARPLRRIEIRQQNETLILQAAEKVFAEAGFGGATMQLIADMAGLPKANLHYYFPTKEALYRQVVQNIFEIWLQAAGSMDRAPGPVEGIGAYIDAKMEISRRHPNGSKVWASEVMHGAPVIQDYLETTLRDWTNGQIRSGQMSLDDSRAFMAMSMKIPVAGGLTGELPAANDSTRYDFTQKARAGIEGATARNDSATLKMLQSAMSIMQSQTGGVDIRA